MDKRNFPRVLILFLCAFGWSHYALAEQLQQARVTQVVNDVKLLPTQAAPRPATVNDEIRPGTAVRTGTDSRTELTFADLTITRLGANTVFSFRPETRSLKLNSGAVLIQVPPGAPEVKVSTAAVSAAISGGTAIFDATTGKFMVLEGIGRVWPTGHPEQAVTVHAGEMVWLGPNGLITAPETFDVALVMETSLLITDFAPLPNLDLIVQVIKAQEAEAGTNTAPPPPSRTSEDIISQRAAASPSPTPQPAATETPSTPTPTPATPTPTPAATPTPSKTGTPQTISSPVPYVIGSNTVLTTDPTITSNGVTDFGKIYRGSAVDGPASAYAFGSTSSFDTSSGFDAQIVGSGAVFKFTALELAGNPTIDITNGETSLGLIAETAITSGLPGGVLTFAGIRGLLLATQDGPITLGPEISFSGLHDLSIYARGATSDLTLGSNIATTSHVNLFAERDMLVSSSIISPNRFYAVAGRDMALGSTTIQTEMLTLTAFHDLSWNGETSDETASNSDGNVLISANNNVNIASDLNFTRHNGGNTAGLNLEVDAGGALTVQGSLMLTADNSMGSSLDTGGNITLNAGASLTVSGEIGLSLIVDNSNGGHIGTGGNISVTTGGDLTAPSINVLVNNRNSGSIGSGGNITFNVGGGVTTIGDASFVTTNRNDGSGGGTMGSDVALSLNAASMSIGGSLTTSISANAGGNITGSASNNIFLVGDLSTQGDVTVLVQDTGYNPNGFLGGGTIGSNAIINLNASNIFTGGVLDLEIDSDGGGNTGGNVVMNIAASGNITTQSDAFFNIFNNTGTNVLNGAPPGTIGGNASINIAANTISIGGFFQALINTNSGGRIGGDAIDTVSATGNVTAQNGIDLTITPGVFGGRAGGGVGGNALVTLSAQNITTPSTASGTPGANRLAIEASIYPNAGGTVGGNAIVNVSASQNISAPGTVFFTVANGNFQNLGGGMIGGNAQADVSASNLFTGALFDDIYNYSGGHIGGDAVISLNLSNAFTASGNAEFVIFNSGGTITRAASIAVTASDISAPALTAEIDNSGAGQIGSTAAINFTISGTGTITNDATFEILGSDGAVSGSAINFNGGTYNVGGTFLAETDGSGTITFNNASVSADVVKIGALGTNGTLTVGGGSLNANTLLKLYAPGSNGVIDFVGNVTLNSQGAAAVIAANTVTIGDRVIVTITGNGGPALVYTNAPNYSGSGGNGTTSGTFAGNGASTNALSQAPPFDSAPANTSVASAAASTSSAQPQPGSSGGAGGGAKELDGRMFGSFAAAAKNTAITEAGETNRGADKRIGFRVSDTSQLLEIVNDPAASEDLMSNRRRSNKAARSSRSGVDDRSRHRSRPPSQRDLATGKGMDNLTGRSPRP